MSGAGSSSKGALLDVLPEEVLLQVRDSGPHILTWILHEVYPPLHCETLMPSLLY